MVSGQAATRLLLPAAMMVRIGTLAVTVPRRRRAATTVLGRIAVPAVTVPRRRLPAAKGLDPIVVVRIAVRAATARRIPAAMASAPAAMARRRLVVRISIPAAMRRRLEAMPRTAALAVMVRHPLIATILDPAAMVRIAARVETVPRHRRLVATVSAPAATDRRRLLPVAMGSALAAMIAVQDAMGRLRRRPVVPPVLPGIALQHEAPAWAIA